MDLDALTDAYLRSLDLSRAPPGMALLTEIVRRHVAQYAFASLGPRLGDPLPLDPAALYERIVLRRRGGYCFEHNGLLYAVLQQLGYAVQLRLARVLNNRDVMPGLTHRISELELDGRHWLVDVGFGALGPPLPVALDGRHCVRNGRAYWIAAGLPGEWLLQTLHQGAPYTLYRFERSRYSQADCELGHFYSHRHPDATFVNHLVASRIDDHCIYALRNRSHSVIDANGETVSPIESAAQLHTLLTTVYGLHLSTEESERLFG